jgi:hypothetical protein
MLKFNGLGQRVAVMSRLVLLELVPDITGQREGERRMEAVTRGSDSKKRKAPLV